MSYDVTVIGEIYTDHVFSGFTRWPQPGEEIFTEDYVSELGGGAVTTACALVRLGRSVQLIGMVGAEQRPVLQARLEDFGVSTNHLLDSPLRTGITVSVSTRDDRTFFTCRGANAELGQRLLLDPHLLDRAAASRHVHLAFPITVAEAAQLLPALHRTGATLSLDVGHHVSWLTDTAVQQILQAIDYFFPNEKEASILAGSATEYLAYARRLNLPNALVKLGPAGAALLKTGVEYRATAPDVQVVDTTGAGDAFNAGFIEALLQNLPPQQSLEYACICGALSTRSSGALQALPTREQVHAASEGANAA